MADPILGEQQFVPNPLTPNYRTRFHKDPVSGRMLVQYSVNGGASWLEFIGQPPSNASEGWIPSLGPSGTVVWRPISSLVTRSVGPESSDSSRRWADLQFPGTVFTGKNFGYFVVPQGLSLECYGAQISIFSPAQGLDIVIDFFSIDQNLPQNKLIVMPQSQVFEQVFLDTPISMPSGSSWQLRITQVGSVDPGEFLACRLLMSVL